MKITNTLACLTLALVTTVASGAEADAVYRSPDQVGPDSIVYWQGEYVGRLQNESEESVWAAQVVARRNDNYELVLYCGGLPGHSWDPEQGKQRLESQLRDEQLVFEQEEGPRYEVDDGTIRVLGEEGDVLGTLERIVRTSPTLGLEPPEEATVLFDGSDVAQWRDGASMTDEGLLNQGARTAEEYGDMFLHVEYLLPFWDSSRRTNSGLYIQNRYEVQILDSFGHSRGTSEDGALYRFRSPDVNATLPPYHWQTFDLLFHAPRFDEEGEKTENARISVYHNGILIHEDVEMESGTGRGGTRDEVPREHLYLQAHRGPAFFRNVWLVPDADQWPQVVRERVE